MIERGGVLTINLISFYLINYFVRIYLYIIYYLSLNFFAKIIIKYIVFVGDVIWEK